MAERFAVVRMEAPDHPFGYARGGEALRWLGKLEEAEAVIGAGLARFPAALELLIQGVLVASDRADCPWRRNVRDSCLSVSRAHASPIGMPESRSGGSSAMPSRMPCWAKRCTHSASSPI
jgi:hypothetical protein